MLPKLTPLMAAPKDMGEAPRPEYDGRRRAAEDIFRCGREGLMGAAMGWGAEPVVVDDVLGIAADVDVDVDVEMWSGTRG